MTSNSSVSELFSGFSRLSQAERFQRLLSLGALTEGDIRFLESGGITETSLAEKLIENVVGYFQLPLGVATYFRIDGRDYVIPLAVEETSIVAALSKTAKWIRESGTITTKVLGDAILGQIQIANVSDFARFESIILKNKHFLIEKVNQEVASNMVKRGGGVLDLSVRQLRRPDEGQMAILHLTMNCCDAMGANIINQVLEYLKTPIEHLTGETVSMCILSNLNDQKLVFAEVNLAVDRELGERIQEASIFAETDAYRAATHNKGVMNGIDPVLIATGNDWRAVEAGIHAYACRDGHYSAITRWRYEHGILKGILQAPIVVGTVGGVTSLHPTAKLCLRMMKIESANQLSRVIAAVGLVQNLGALRALCTEGIIEGHMKLHIDNLILNTDAKETEIPLLKEKLQSLLHVTRRVSLKSAVEMLADLRRVEAT